MRSQKTIYNLTFNETLSYTQGRLTYTWLRVPGGWNLTVESKKGITNTFIPQRDELKEWAHEMENKATDLAAHRIMKE